MCLLAIQIRAELASKELTLLHMYCLATDTAAVAVAAAAAAASAACFLVQIRAELASKELALLQKEQELLDKEQTLLVLKEEVGQHITSNTHFVFGNSRTSLCIDTESASIRMHTVTRIVTQDH